jgi:membrane protein DedA with SNARE-associated domain
MIESDPPSSPARVRPTIRPRHKQDVICGAGLLAGIAASYAFVPLTPKLLARHDLFLEAVTGSATSMVTGGAFARVGQLPLTFVVLAPLISIALYDLFVWWAGRLWGNHLLVFYSRNNPRLARRIQRVERLVRRRGMWALVLAYYLPLPTYLVYVACGTSGMPLWLFVIGDALGTLLWEALLVTLGWELGHRAVHIVGRINHYSTIILIVLVVAVFALAVIRSYRQVRRARAG